MLVLNLLAQAFKACFACREAKIRVTIDHWPLTIDHWPGWRIEQTRLQRVLVFPTMPPLSDHEFPLNWYAFESSLCLDDFLQERERGREREPPCLMSWCQGAGGDWAWIWCHGTRRKEAAACSTRSRTTSTRGRGTRVRPRVTWGLAMPQPGHHQ